MSTRLVGITHGWCRWRRRTGPRWRPRSPLPKDAPHPRQQESPEEQLLAQHRVEDGQHDDHRVPAPRAAEEVLATIVAHEVAEVPHRGARDARQSLLEGEDEDEQEQPPPHPPAHAAALRIAGRPQPQSIAHARPFQATQLPPGEYQDENELPAASPCNPSSVVAPSESPLQRGRSTLAPWADRKRMPFE